MSADAKPLTHEELELIAPDILNAADEYAKLGSPMTALAFSLRALLATARAGLEARDELATTQQEASKNWQLYWDAIHSEPSEADIDALASVIDDAGSYVEVRSAIAGFLKRRTESSGLRAPNGSGE